MTGQPLLHRLEVFYDSLPRAEARAESIGAFTLFVREGTGWPFYARPLLPFTGTAEDIAAVRARQRELRVPESFEWLDDLAPDLLAIAREAGLEVLEAPLLLLDPDKLPTTTPLPPGVRVRILDPTDERCAAELAAHTAVARVGFGAAGTAVGRAGPTDRDRITVPVSEAEVAQERRRVTEGRLVRAVAESDRHGFLGVGSLQRAGEVAEVTGVATLPMARRQGLGAAVTVALARHALTTGAQLVIVSAVSEEVCRLYQRLGFQRIGTACIAQPPPLRP